MTFPLAASVTEAIGTLNGIIDWSIDAAHPLGCFTCVHRHTDALILDALDRGTCFTEPEGIERLATLLANTYISVINGVISDATPLAWESALDPEPTLLRSLMLPMNVHVLYDLGLSVAQMGADGYDLQSLQLDFERTNEINHLSWKLYGPVARRCSPAAHYLNPLIPERLWESLLARLRRTGWRFGTDLVHSPEDAERIKQTQLAYVGRSARRWCWAMRPLSRGESRDVVANIKLFRAQDKVEL